MTYRFKTLALQTAAIAASATLMFAVSAVTRAAPAPAVAVRIENFTFKNKVVTVKPGTTVSWTNGDDAPHIIVSRNGLFKSPALDTGDRFSFTFAKAGQFGYFCSLHPQMTGTIVVKA